MFLSIIIIIIVVVVVVVVLNVHYTTKSLEEDIFPVLTQEPVLPSDQPHLKAVHKHPSYSVNYRRSTGSWP